MPDTVKLRELYRYLQKYATSVVAYEGYGTYYEVKLPLDEDEFVKCVLEIANGGK